MKNFSKQLMVISGVALIAASLSVGIAQDTPAWRRVADKIGNQEVAAGEAVEAVMEPTTNEGVEESGVSEEFESTSASLDNFSMLEGESTLDLGSELDEPEAIPDIFKDENNRRLLGDNPKFLYDANDRPDPMVFPPMRRAAIAKHLFEEVELILKESKTSPRGSANPELARTVFPLLEQIKDLGDERFVALAETKIQEVNTALNVGSATTSVVVDGTGSSEGEMPAAEPVLPDWIRGNTKALVAMSNNPMCLIGDEAVRLGEQVPKYEQVVVVSIEDNKVVFEVSNASKSKRFDVELEPYESAGFWR